ncbi:MAG TPA: hypothetical protein EYP60_07375 [bacterium (Candidatus Stahlbacteria)]|nr:hypothetical protein [Candidatus Stahlbacteria bacterium]
MEGVNNTPILAYFGHMLVPFRVLKISSSVYRAILILAVHTIILVGCKYTVAPNNTHFPIVPADSVQMPARGFFMGILPTPAAGQDLASAYVQAALYAEFVPVWGRPTPFYQLANELSGAWGNIFVEQLIRDNGMFPLVHMSFIGASGNSLVLVTPPGLESATLSDSAWQQAYLSAAVEVLCASHPLYMSVGNEVNRWYEAYGVDDDNPNGFQHFATLYKKIYDTLKVLSPETKIFCTFAREIVFENREADLSVLELFDSEHLDLLVFTSYPYSVQGINRPADIPDNYFSRAFDHIDMLPIGFSELGWLVHDFFGGEQSQADFIDAVADRLTRAQGLNLELFGWAWLHDLPGGDSIGLISYDGKEKLAYARWKSLSMSEP